MCATRKRYMTLAEHDAWLKSQGRYDAMLDIQRKQDEVLRQREAEYRRAEEPLIAELRAAGFAVKSAWDLVNTSTPYPQALPILLRHLSRPYPPAVREGIARAMAVRDSRFAWPVLAALFRSEQEERVKDGLAVALAQAADDEVIGELIALARDVNHGPTRMLLLSALERSQDPRARQTLEDLQADPQVHCEAQKILQRLQKRRSQRPKKKR